MKTLSIPLPPDPSIARYRDNPLAWARAAADWMQRTKGLVENAHNEVSRPCGQQIIASAYTTSTAVTGTTTGTDLANFVCTLVDALTAGGVLSPTITRGQNQ